MLVTRVALLRDGNQYHQPIDLGLCCCTLQLISQIGARLDHLYQPFLLSLTPNTLILHLLLIFFQHPVALLVNCRRCLIHLRHFPEVPQSRNDLVVYLGASKMQSPLVPSTLRMVLCLHLEKAVTTCSWSQFFKRPPYSPVSPRGTTIPPSVKGVEGTHQGCATIHALFSQWTVFLATDAAETAEIFSGPHYQQPGLGEPIFLCSTVCNILTIYIITN